jgi:hypothetical protein
VGFVGWLEKRFTFYRRIEPGLMIRDANLGHPRPQSPSMNVSHAGARRTSCRPLAGHDDDDDDDDAWWRQINREGCDVRMCVVGRNNKNKPTTS